MNERKNSRKQNEQNETITGITVKEICYMGTGVRVESTKKSVLN